MINTEGHNNIPYKILEVEADTLYRLKIDIQAKFSIDMPGFKIYKGHHPIFPFVKQDKVSKYPQYFRINNSITAEAIEHSSEQELGRRIKEMYSKLKEQVKLYENNQIQ